MIDYDYDRDGPLSETIPADRAVSFSPAPPHTAWDARNPDVPQAGPTALASYIDAATARHIADLTDEQRDEVAHRLWSQTQCGRGAIIGINPWTTRVLIVPLRCKSWECKTCAPIKREQWIRKLARGKATKVMTLTADPRIAVELPARARKMKTAFTKLIARIKFHATLDPRLRWLPPRNRRQKRAAMRKRGAKEIRGLKQEVEYALVWELKGSNHLHVHVLLRSPYIPWGWLKWNWSHLGIGMHVHIKQARDPSWEAEHGGKQLCDTIRPRNVDPQDYITKAASATAYAIAPLRLVQISNGWEIISATTTESDDHKDWTWQALRRSAANIVAEFLVRKIVTGLVCRGDGSYALDIVEGKELTDFLDDEDNHFGKKE